MEHIIWLVIMTLCGAVFTGIGLYARRRKKPMWFWSGTTVTEITDIPAYNRANSRMWLVYSLPFWLSVPLEFWSGLAALILVAANGVVGLPVLIAVYKRIYAKYRAR